MAFTYDLSNDNGQMRFYLRDRVEASAKFTDEELAFALSEAGSVKAGVLLSIRVLMMDMANPDYKADWLSESNHADVLEAMQKLYDELSKEFGINSFAVMIPTVYGS